MHNDTAIAARPLPRRAAGHLVAGFVAAALAISAGGAAPAGAEEPAPTATKASYEIGFLKEMTGLLLHPWVIG